MTGSVIATLARLLTGARARWRGCDPLPRQRVYFANHTSNLDFVLLWSSLPNELRKMTRPVGAQDYWRGGMVREYLAANVFRAVLIERLRVTRENNPLQPMLTAIDEGSSLIIFPEGTRCAGEELGEFKAGLYHLAKARPHLEFVPVYIENLSRVLPKGEFLPVPILCSVNFGAPLEAPASDPKPQFLARAREAVCQLQPQ